MPALTTNTSVPDYPGFIWTEFQPTPKTAAYLLMLAISGTGFQNIISYHMTHTLGSLRQGCQFGSFLEPNGTFYLIKTAICPLKLIQTGNPGTWKMQYLVGSLTAECKVDTCMVAFNALLRCAVSSIPGIVWCFCLKFSRQFIIRPKSYTVK